MKTISIDLYTYDELTPEAKECALNDWNKNGNSEDPFMESHMITLLKEKLDERKISYDADSIDIYYSLSYSQGDGFMFEGTLEFEGSSVTIKHSGHYYNSYNKHVTWNDFSGEENESKEEEKIAEKFETIYQDICKEMETIGYQEIEFARSEEAFQQTCDANEYTFEANGTMRNE